jgi:hypothetical protein
MAVLYRLSYRGMQAEVIISVGPYCVNPNRERNKRSFKQGSCLPVKQRSDRFTVSCIGFIINRADLGIRFNNLPDTDIVAGRLKYILRTSQAAEAQAAAPANSASSISGINSRLPTISAFI